MNNDFNQIFNFFSNGTPMDPKASWLLILLLVPVSALAAYVIVELDKFLSLAIYNAKIAGIKTGVISAVLGQRAYAIRQERVISVTEKDYGFVAHTFDGENSGEYHILATEADDSDEYDTAIKLAGDNKTLLDSLLPSSRVQGYFNLYKEETDEELDFFVVYLRYNCVAEVEEALNKYFEEEFHKELRSARKLHKVVKAVKVA